MALNNKEHPYDVAVDIVKKASTRINVYNKAIEALKAKKNSKYDAAIKNYKSDIELLSAQKEYGNRIIEHFSSPEREFWENQLQNNVYHSFDRLKQTRDSIPTNNEDIAETNALLIAVNEGIIDTERAYKYMMYPKPLSQLTTDAQAQRNPIRNTGTSQNTNAQAASSSTAEQHTQQVSHKNRGTSSPQNKSVKTINQSKASSSAVDTETSKTTEQKNASHKAAGQNAIKQKNTASKTKKQEATRQGNTNQETAGQKTTNQKTKNSISIQTT